MSKKYILELNKEELALLDATCALAVAKTFESKEYSFVVLMNTILRKRKWELLDVGTKIHEKAKEISKETGEAKENEVSKSFKEALK